MKFDEAVLYYTRTAINGKRYSLFDLAKWKNGFAFKKNDFSDFGKPIIKIAELNNGITSTTAYTEGKYSPEVHLTKGDMLFSWSGNPKTSIDVYWYNLPDGWLNQHIFKVTPEMSVVDKYFFYYMLKYLKPVFTAIAMNKQTTGLGHVTISDLKRLSVIVPDRTVQRNIANILKAFDHKIELNNAINDNLVEQARSIFQSWFIDYEPFGGSMPSDWHSSTLGQIAIMKTDSWSPAKNPNVVVEHYSIPAFDEKRYPVFEIASGIKSNKYLLTPESVMISKLNPDTKRIWRPICLSEHPVCSTEFIVYEAKKCGQRDYIYSLIDSVPFFNHLCSHTTGSTNSRQRATPKSTLDFALHLAPDSIIEDFCQIVTPMYDLIATNTVENQSLAKTRDSLLPLLMSGKLDVSDLDL